MEILNAKSTIELKILQANLEKAQGAVNGGTQFSSRTEEVLDRVDNALQDIKLVNTGIMQQLEKLANKL